MQLLVKVTLLVLSPFSLPANAAPFVYVVTLTQQFGTIDLANGKFQPTANGTADGLSNLVWWRGSLRTHDLSHPGSLAKINSAPDQATRSLPRQPPPASATCNSHRPAASAANASDFLLTVLSNARTNNCFLRTLHLARVR
jgi:hypothetical protein